MTLLDRVEELKKTINQTPKESLQEDLREVIDIGDDEHSHNVDVLEEDDEAIDEYQHIADYREQEMLSLNQ